MATIGKWILNYLLGWLVEYVRGLVETYIKRKQVEKERAEDNKKAEEKLEKAETEQEVIDAGADHLTRR